MLHTPTSQPLFIQHKSAAELLTKEAAAIARMPDDDKRWPAQVLSEIHKQLPFMSKYDVDIEMTRVEPEAGYAIGYAILRNKTGRQRAEEQLGKPTNKLRVPVIVADRMLQPFHVFEIGGKVYPLTQDRVESAMMNPAMFDGAADPPGTRSLLDQIYPPFQHRQGYGMMSGDRATQGVSKLSSAPNAATKEAVVGWLADVGNLGIPSALGYAIGDEKTASGELGPLREFLREEILEKSAASLRQQVAQRVGQSFISGAERKGAKAVAGMVRPPTLPHVPPVGNAGGFMPRSAVTGAAAALPAAAPSAAPMGARIQQRVYRQGTGTGFRSKAVPTVAPGAATSAPVAAPARPTAPPVKPAPPHAGPPAKAVASNEQMAQAYGGHYVAPASAPTATPAADMGARIQQRAAAQTPAAATQAAAGQTTASTPVQPAAPAAAPASAAPAATTATPAAAAPTTPATPSAATDANLAASITPDQAAQIAANRGGPVKPAPATAPAAPAGGAAPATVTPVAPVSPTPTSPASAPAAAASPPANPAATNVGLAAGMTGEQARAIKDGAPSAPASGRKTLRDIKAESAARASTPEGIQQQVQQAREEATRVAEGKARAANIKERAAKAQQSAAARKAEAAKKTPAAKSQPAFNERAAREQAEAAARQQQAHQAAMENPQARRAYLESKGLNPNMTPDQYQALNTNYEVARQAMPNLTMDQFIAANPNTVGRNVLFGRGSSLGVGAVPVRPGAAPTAPVAEAAIGGKSLTPYLAGAALLGGGAYLANKATDTVSQY